MNVEGLSTQRIFTLYLVPRLHVQGEEVGQTISVEVARIHAHGKLRIGLKAFICGQFKTLASAIQIQVIVLVKIVGDKHIQITVAVKVLGDDC